MSSSPRNVKHGNKPGELKQAWLQQVAQRVNLTSEQILSGESKNIAWGNLLQLLEKFDSSEIVERANRNRDADDELTEQLLRNRCCVAVESWSKISGTHTAIRLEFILNDRRVRNGLKPLVPSWFPNSASVTQRESLTQRLRNHLVEKRQADPTLVNPDQSAPWDPVDVNKPKFTFKSKTRWFDPTIYDRTPLQISTLREAKRPKCQSQQGESTRSESSLPSNARPRMMPSRTASAARSGVVKGETEPPLTPFMATLAGISKKRPESTKRKHEELEEGEIRE
ncbi:hypothetical protein CB0940_06286 [Cercospora beticola]|uniref:Uncharacterized protein n=1 Tax=Cercospora beticola TaxID=122368 RepID=A0A2G5HYK1_CERBT|nr:hypothetical protein CB0940_06286 [Cercospora beticola]PIA97606.1 hypothetical protein CB0940_06286 [Cercospora beticola]WPA98906.1 hypothetical protein RHO25_003519 [Cercospora beticola]CAK1360202.1 unnamed protein product [Cercospora beticola]